ncbi:MAG: DNA polymerase/3'-5' exonuclease PolX [Patescibacteria group bacterium]|nr:DNA polymerase/3'-5' exonuclease PolX [Patescibacteria group bacterium]
MTNSQVAELLRSIAAAYAIKGGNRFQIAAYETAADSIEHMSGSLQDFWAQGTLDSVPGVGSHLATYLDELFQTGKVRHFEETVKGIPEATFDFLKIPGVGPKTAYKIAEAGVISIADLEKRIQSGYLEKKGFGKKTLQNILRGIEEFRRKSDRILLPLAWETAEGVLNYLRAMPEVKQADSLGSLRRMVATVGDVDLSVASKEPKKVIDFFTRYPEAARVIEAGDKTATIALKSGIRVDLMVQPPEHYGSLLQHFTGSKSHNIALRTYALGIGYSLSEYGVKEEKSGKTISCPTENDLYDLLKMQTPPPELREGTGEIEAALKLQLPRIITTGKIKGDLHTHTVWSDGQNTLAEMVEGAKSLGYEYLAITDHSYPNLDFEKRIFQIEQYNYSKRDIRVIIGLEVNISADSTLQIPDKILQKHEFIIASIHTSFRQPKEQITARLISAIENPYVDMIAHPTGRLLLEREGYEADWEKVFEACVKHDKILEINAFPNRLDLPDNLVRSAVAAGVKLAINTDSHHVSQLSLMPYGVSVARRGWAGEKGIVNTLPWNKVKSILKIN